MFLEYFLIKKCKNFITDELSLLSSDVIKEEKISFMCKEAKLNFSFLWHPPNFQFLNIFIHMNVNTWLNVMWGFPYNYSKYADCSCLENIFLRFFSAYSFKLLKLCHPFKFSKWLPCNHIRKKIPFPTWSCRIEFSFTSSRIPQLIIKRSSREFFISHKAEEVVWGIFQKVLLFYTPLFVSGKKFS